VTWSLDGTRILVATIGGRENAAIWSISPITDHARKLFDGGGAVATCPEGAALAYSAAGSGELRLARIATGDHRLATAGPERRFRLLAWAADGRQIAALVIRNHDERASWIQVFGIDGSGSPRTVLATDADLQGLAWDAKRRIYYARSEPSPLEGDAVWELQVGPDSRATGAPRRLARWPGYKVNAVSASQDGSRVAANRVRMQSDIVVAELAPDGRSLVQTRRLTTTDAYDWPSSWTNDGAGVLFASDRTGKFSAFVQEFDRPARRLITDHLDSRSPHPLPGGDGMVYLAWPPADAAAGSSTIRVMYLASPGGRPEPVLEARGITGFALYHGLGQLAAAHRGGRGYPDLRCAAGDPRCVLAEAGEKEVTFTAIDPLGGRLGELARVDHPPAQVLWDLSADGLRLVVVHSTPRAPDRVKVFDLSTRRWREFDLDGWSSAVAWAADGRSVFATRWRVDGSELLRVGLDGEVVLLQSTPGAWMSSLRPSPDGRHLAYAHGTAASNMWLLERSPPP
jgi:hypothetical protein